MTPPANPLLVALGDSLAWGRGDPAPGGGWRGWVPRLAVSLGIPQDRVVNTGVDGAFVADVVAHQIPLVQDIRPRIVAFICGMNDITGGTDPHSVRRELDALLTWATRTGALVLTSGVLPYWDRLPISRIRRSRLQASVTRFNEDLATGAARHGASFLEPIKLASADDPTMWAADGIHLSSAGHQVIAQEFARLVGERLP